MAHVDLTATAERTDVRRAAPRWPARRWLARLGWGVALTTVLMLLLVPVAAVSGSSMSPTLADGDHVAVDRWSARVTGWHRGDLVVVEAPAGSPEQGLLVKRVVALSGDVVALRDGVLTVNRHPVDEPYADPDLVDSVYFGPVRVPEGRVFVLGDNRRQSVDSRHFGAVPVPQLRGRVVATVWPPSHLDLGVGGGS